MTAGEHQAAIVVALEPVWSQFEADVSKPRKRGYALALSDLDLEQIKRAVMSALQRWRPRYRGHVPSPAEFRDFLPGQSAEAMAERAWQSVVKWIASCSGYRSWILDDEITHAAVRSVGGRRILGEMTPNNFHTWGRRRFVEAYINLCTQGITPDLLTPIGGAAGVSSETGIYQTGIPGARSKDAIQLGCGKLPPRLRALTEGIGNG